MAKTIIFLTLCTLLILPVVLKDIDAKWPEITNEAFGNTSPCKCVVFRLDDIHDNYLDEAQLKIMDLFLSKGAPLSLGLIMHDFGNDSLIVDKVSEGYKKGLFELDLHGWEHKNYSDMSEQEQKSSLFKANERLQSIFGQKSDIFIPPFNAFDNATLNAIKELGITILSSSTTDQNRFDSGRSIFNSYAKIQDNSTQGIYFLPQTTNFKDKIGSSLITIPNEKIAKNINASIKKSGYAVVLIHPRSIMNADESGRFNSDGADKAQINNNDVKDLEYLIDLLKQRGIPISTFHEILNDTYS